jgi:N-acetylglucosaminyldiphosphoundecaprenol N-acetyl-beta-D-mannosaminyltransferase
MFIEGYKNKDFQKIINDSEFVTPDGQPLIWTLNWLYGIKQERISGMDLLPALLERMSTLGISAFFYGGTEIMMKITQNYIAEIYPNLKIAGFHSPPFSEQNEILDDKIMERINNSSPVILFVVLGCPKQEKWMYSIKDKLNTVMIGIGGALPVMIGMQKRAPKWMQKYGLEWLFRLYQEPRRLFKRYLYTNTLFLWIFIKEFFKIKFNPTSKIKSF